MNYYIAQVKTREEEKYIKHFENLYPESEINLYFPKKTVREKVKDKTVIKDKPLIKGYVIVECDERIDIRYIIKRFKEASGFIRFLKTNTDVTKLTGQGKELVLFFIKHKSTGISKVHYNENDRIVIEDGVLKGMEGQIIKVDRRRQRAKILLDICGASMTFEFSFEVVKQITR
ncbi:hypothetical protein FACS1894190_07130 [Spirochaetia bacterium]|nr:hypothetical protein FACS1894190_07130 [Spirochaetia bacterium]